MIAAQNSEFLPLGKSDEFICEVEEVLIRILDWSSLYFFITLILHWSDLEQPIKQGLMVGEKRKDLSD
jgi:hypothetical protein